MVYILNKNYASALLIYSILEYNNSITVCEKIFLLTEDTR